MAEKAQPRSLSFHQKPVSSSDPLQITGNALKHWAIAQLLDSLAVGVLWFIGLRILHIPLSFLWAAAAAMLQIIPHLGPILGLLGPTITALIAWRDWRHPGGVLLLYAIIVVVDGFLLQPYLMRRTAKVPIWASIVVPIVLGFVWPFWGVLIAPPLLAVFYAHKAQLERRHS